MHSPKTHILKVHRNWVTNREQWWEERNRIPICFQPPTCRSRSLMFVWLASRRKRARHPARTFCSDDVSNQPTKDTNRDCRRDKPADTQSINQYEYHMQTMQITSTKCATLYNYYNPSIIRTINSNHYQNPESNPPPQTHQVLRSILLSSLRISHHTDNWKPQ